MMRMKCDEKAAMLHGYFLHYCGLFSGERLSISSHYHGPGHVEKTC